MTRTSQVSLLILTIFLVGLMAVLRAQTPPPSKVPTPLNAAAVLPLPEELRSAATIVERGVNGQYKVVRKGGNGIVCSAGKTTDGNFHASCAHELIFAAQMRRAALEGEFGKAGKPTDAKTLTAALTDEIKAGKVKLPDHPTTEFRMSGPASGYNAAANTVSSEIKKWQMIHIPFATGASLSLPEKATPGMPWVMGSGMWNAHVMVEH